MSWKKSRDLISQIDCVEGYWPKYTLNSIYQNSSNLLSMLRTLNNPYENFCVKIYEGFHLYELNYNKVEVQDICRCLDDFVKSERSFAFGMRYKTCIL